MSQVWFIWTYLLLLDLGAYGFAGPFVPVSLRNAHAPPSSQPGFRVNPSDMLSLVSELAIALVAAAGIVTAIGGRDREYTALDRVTIRGLVFVAATPLTVALLGLIVLSADVPDAEAWPILSFAYVGLLIARYALTLPASLRIRQQDRSLPRRGLVVFTVLALALTLFVLYNAIVLAAFWPILTACTFEFLSSVWLILRLILGGRYTP